MAKITTILPEPLVRQLARLGYRRVTKHEQRVFDPYYDAMNDHWTSAACFLCILAWRDAIPTFYKPVGGLLCCLQYDGTVGEWTAIPFMGRYSPESVGNAFRVLRADMEALRFPLKVMELSEWMLPFYQGLDGISWEVERPRELADYIYRRTDFENALNSSDNRYRYRYFLRRFSPETVVLTPDRREECMDFMRAAWCPGRECADCFCCPVETIGNVTDALDAVRADGVLVRVDGKPAGFCITTCRNGLGIYQFKHAYNHMKGINEYLLRECFTRFLSGAEEINFTDDMGVESLRAYKSRLAPYTLSPRIVLRGKASNDETQA